VLAKGLRYLRSNTLGALALFVALGGTGFATTNVFSQGGTLHACASGEGRLKLLKAGGRCGRGQTAVAWNQAGRQGSKGTPGATGATGAPGAAGSKGADGESATVKWAAIGGHAELGATHGVIAAHETGAHFYEVTFDSDITNCAVTATPNGTVGLSVVVNREGPGVLVKFLTTNKEEAHLSEFSIVAYC